MALSRFVLDVALAWSASVLVPVALAAAQDAAAPARPNVVLILVDDLGWTDLSCQGSVYYETPNIDPGQRRRPTHPLDSSRSAAATGVGLPRAGARGGDPCACCGQ
jgi:hypothetical protein